MAALTGNQPDPVADARNIRLVQEQCLHWYMFAPHLLPKPLFGQYVFVDDWIGAVLLERRCVSDVLSDTVEKPYSTESPCIGEGSFNF